MANKVTVETKRKKDAMNEEDNKKHALHNTECLEKFSAVLRLTKKPFPFEFLF